MKYHVCAAILGLAVLTGCVVPQTMQTPFDASVFSAYQKQGTGTVTGQAFLKTRGGEVKFGAGNEVEMIPMTPYIRERFNRSMINGERLETRDPRADAYARKTRADGSGNFEFKNIPIGEYAIYCSITWEIPNGFAPIATGGMAFASVKVEEGGTYKVIVTR